MQKAILLVIALVLFIGADAAKRCYSGQNARYAEKQCSSGSMLQDFTCQKFVCEGGKSPFTLRTCGQKTQFVIRSCGFKNRKPCEEEEKLCLQFLGTSRCMTCETDLCNGEPQANTSPLEFQQDHLNNNGLFNFTNAKQSQFNIDRIPSVIDVNSKNSQTSKLPSAFLFVSFTMLLACDSFCWAHF
ncbi:hypothetical protein M3Y97_00129700 [Aphelenchoides bicaudatus]|nr:hypothetical protein M3Y97_00129700 [Aphelenchoides bicaudatus]